MRITSWIIKKKSAHTEEVVLKKGELQAIFFVGLERSLINLWFSNNEIEETDKQTKLRRRDVDHSHMTMLSVQKTVLNCLLRLYVFTNSNNNRSDYYRNDNNNSNNNKWYNSHNSIT